MVIYERLLDKTLWLRVQENARLETDILWNTAGGAFTGTTCGTDCYCSGVGLERTCNRSSQRVFASVAALAIAFRLFRLRLGPR